MWVQCRRELRSPLHAVLGFSCCIAGEMKVGVAPALRVFVITLQDGLGVKGRDSSKAIIYDLVMGWRGQMSVGTTKKQRHRWAFLEMAVPWEER